MKCLVAGNFRAFSEEIRVMSSEGMNDEVNELLEEARRTPGYLRHFSGTTLGLNSNDGAIGF